jgi:hypothetical protein
MLYDITSRQSFESLTYWIQEFQSEVDQNGMKSVIMMIGNKVSLPLLPLSSPLSSPPSLLPASLSPSSSQDLTHFSSV